MLTYNNHFKFGYDYNWFEPRASHQQKWTVQYGECNHPPLSFHEECLRTARMIKQVFPDEELCVLFSGGVDSEVVVRSFYESNIEIKVAILQFNNQLNSHDIIYAINTCNELGISYQIYNLDILNFWEFELYNYTDPTYCISPQLASTMWLIDQIKGIPILGSGECLIEKRSIANKLEWCLLEKERIASWYRFFIEKNKRGCPGFFQFTPEIILSYLKEPTIQQLINNELPDISSTNEIKLKIYQKYFPLVSRPKYTGFEKLQNEDAYFRKKLNEKYPFVDEIYLSPIKNLIENLTPKIR